jgi:hypothetical protein
MSALNAANHTIAQATSTQGRVPPTNGISAVTPPTAIGRAPRLVVLHRPLAGFAELEAQTATCSKLTPLPGARLLSVVVSFE